jgi:adenylate cyclase
MLVRDITKEPEAQVNEFTRQYESPSFVVTPILLGEKTIGVITVNDRRDKAPFTESDLAMLNTFGHQMSMGIANMFIMRKTERAKLKLEFINEIVQNLLSSVDPNEIYKALIGKVMSGLRATAGALIFSDPKGKQLAIECVEPEDRLRRTKGVLPVGGGVMASILREGKVIIENTAKENPAVDMSSDFPPGLEPKNIAATPIKVNSKVLGILAVFNKEEGLSFNGWDREILEAVAPQASMAIKQAWLYQNLIKSIDDVIETNKQLEEANREIKAKISELNKIKMKVTP